MMKVYIVISTFSDKYISNNTQIEGCYNSKLKAIQQIQKLVNNNIKAYSSYNLELDSNFDYLTDQETKLPLFAHLVSKGNNSIWMDIEFIEQEIQ